MKRSLTTPKMRRGSAQDDVRARADDSTVSADAALAKMGYKSELPRNLGMMSVLGLYVLTMTPFLRAFARQGRR